MEQLDEFGGQSTTGGERADHRQGVGALDEIVTGRLAQLLVGCGDIEQIVHDLERHAEAGAEGGERVDLGSGQSGHDPADATCRAQQ